MTNMPRVLPEDAPFEVTPIGSFGAEVSGVSLTETFNDEMVDRLRSLLVRFQILVFRKQPILPRDQLRITRYLGDLECGFSKRPTSHKVAGYPEILDISNRPGSATGGYGAAWHSDGLAYAKVPHGFTLLHCVTCPPGVGATLFANQYGAYEAMPTNLREKLDTLFWYLPNIDYSEIPFGKGLVQPMVRTHSATKRKFLFCSPSACQIRGMTLDEGARTLAIVNDYQIRDEFVYHHSWADGDVVMWENCTLLHKRADVVDFSTHGLRVLHRTATSGNFEAIETEPS